MPNPRHLILSSTGKWIQSSRPHPLALNPLVRHPPAKPSPFAFDTLATDPVSTSIQAPQADEGSRAVFSNAGKVDVGVKQTKPKRVLHGVVIPEKPSAPAEGECCMSGCAHCVYDIYLSDMEIYHYQIATARKDLLSKNVTISPQEWPVELGSMEKSTGGLGAKEEAENAVQAKLATLDPSLRAFLEMEMRMKKKQQAKSNTTTSA